MARFIVEPENFLTVTWKDGEGEDGEGEDGEHWFDAMLAALKDGKSVVVTPPKEGTHG